MFWIRVPVKIISVARKLNKVKEGLKPKLLLRRRYYRTVTAAVS
jgi:hypothetical protein